MATAAGEPTGLAVITVAEDGENTIVVVPGANATVSVDAATEAVASMADGDILLLQGEVPRETIEAAARAAHEILVRAWFRLARAQGLLIVRSNSGGEGPTVRVKRDGGKIVMKFFG